MKKILCLALALTLAVCMLAGCGQQAKPQPRDPGDFHTAEQEKYLAGAYDKISKYANGKEEKSHPRPVVLDFSEQHVKGGSYVLEIGQEAMLGDGVKYTLDKEQMELTNLLLGTTYYWRVAATEEGLADARPMSFSTTTRAPRNLLIDGVTNVRDLGGWKAGNKTVKQGLLFRGGRLNADNVTEPVREITDAGIITFRDELGIKTELDFRRNSDNEIGGIKESVVEGVNYINIELASGLSTNQDAIREIFALLADRENYPIYFHCSIGTDRTGMVAYLINGLLGVEEDDLYRDYLFSNFGNIGSERQATTLQTSVASKIDKYEGTQLKDKVEAFLLSCGVTAEEIASVRSIMLG